MIRSELPTSNRVVFPNPNDDQRVVNMQVIALAKQLFTKIEELRNDVRELAKTVEGLK